MTLRPYKSKGQLTPELLDYWRGRIGRVPDDYQAFLLHTNGGTPTPELVFKISSESEPGYWLVEVTALDYSKGRESLDLQLEGWALDYGDKFLPIGGDGMGNYFVLSLHPNTFGYIYFVDHELRDGDDFSSGMTLVTNSFADFLAHLYETDYAEPDWEEDHAAALQKFLSAPVKPWWRFW